MSNFTLKLNPLSGVESVHIKKGVKWTVIGLGVLMTIIVVGVIMQKGQRNKDKVSAPTPTEINTSMTTKQAAPIRYWRKAQYPRPESGGANAHSNWQRYP
ncbi:hypothetical protein QYZ45_27825 [Vibrio parahaemolyticus]|nr:hypothetical protein [Vibrio parahaemolyticus]